MELKPRNPNHAKFTVRGPEGACYAASNSHAIAIWMWGRDVRKYSIYVTLEPLPTEIIEMEREIDRMVGLLESKQNE